MGNPSWGERVNKTALKWTILSLFFEKTPTAAQIIPLKSKFNAT